MARTKNGVYERVMFLLLDLFVGSTAAGAVGPAMPFPAALEIDFVRAYVCLDRARCGA